MIYLFGDTKLFELSINISVYTNRKLNLTIMW